MMNMKNKSGLIITVMLVLSVLCFGTVYAKNRILVDQTGRAVEVPESPRRVVSLAPSITEIVYDLQSEDRLIGATIYSDYPEAARRLPKVGSYVSLDLEKIVSLNPDLCIGIKDGNPKATVMRLEALGIPVYAVNPRSLETIYATVIEMGGLLQATRKAEELATGMRSRIDHVAAIAAKADFQPRVFFQIGISPIVTAGADTFIHELIITAGGKNIAGDQVSYPRYSTEEVVVSSPDIIIITSMAREKVFEKVKAKWSQWPNMPAVKNDRIFLVDSDLFDRPTPRLIDGLDTLARLIHPELNFD